MLCALSTIDNPYDYFSDFDNWYNFDMVKGYNCCAVLDRNTYTSDSLSPSEQEDVIEEAIDRIISHDPLNLYTKVTPKT